MTLRLRLTIALVALATVGLAVFGVVTYSLYARSLYQRLDDQIRSTVPLVSAELQDEIGPSRRESFGGGPGGSPDEGRDESHPPAPTVRVPPGTYGELRDSLGRSEVSLPLGSSSARPDLPDELPAASPDGRFFTTASVGGSGRWRVYVGPADRVSRRATVVAVPSDDVRASLNRLVFIEVTAGIGLLTLLGTGSWLILRRGLRPLERMAQSAATITAGTITAGNLSQRVAPSDDRTEVGQLGLALNTMLSEIESAFRERHAVEARLRQFLSDASHELRTPLTSIQGFAEMFRLDAEADHVNLEVILRRIEEETARHAGAGRRPAAARPPR